MLSPGGRFRERAEPTGSVETPHGFDYPNGRCRRCRHRACGGSGGGCAGRAAARRSDARRGSDRGPGSAPLAPHAPRVRRLKVGLNRIRIERRAGRSLKRSCSTGSCAIWTIRGVRGLSIMTTGGRLARVDITRGSWRTSVGVRLGDSESTVRSRYPRLRRQQHAYDPDGEYLIVRGRKRRVVFETNGDDKVTGFRGGRVPEVMYIEGCA